MRTLNKSISKSMIGDKVKNTEGIDLGEIKEILIDGSTGKVEYGILSFGGFMGVGDKQVAIPIECLNYHEEEKYFELNADKDVLEDASTEIEYQGRVYYIY